MKDNMCRKIMAHKLLESLRDYPIEMIDFWVVDNFREFQNLFFKDDVGYPITGEFFLESTPCHKTLDGCKLFTCIHVQLVNAKTNCTWYDLTLNQCGEVKNQRIMNPEHPEDPLVTFFYHLKQGLMRKDWKIAEDKNIIKTGLMKFIKEIWK